MATKNFLFSVIAGLAAASTAGAEDKPLSAIDWLSNSVTLETPAPQQPVAPSATLPQEIRVMPLDAPVPDTAGLVDGSTLGLAPGLWGRSSAADLARGLAALGDVPDAPPSLNRFVIDLISARLDPPIDAAVDDAFFLARIDRLLAMGHLEAAAQLTEQAGSSEPRRFRRAFDIALLTGTETDACRIIEETPDLSPTYPARIFCLARLGQWDVAALTLGNAETLDILSPREDALLLRFLDPDLFEDDPLPPAPNRPSPLVFRLYEAVGERIPTDQLPVAFAVTDLSDTVGWKTRLRAAERLAGVGALSFEAMLAIYQEREPAASGGIWERVEAVQALLRATEPRDAARIAETLPKAWVAAQEGGYEAGFARWMVQHLVGLQMRGQPAHLAFEIALLAGDTDLAAGFANTSPEDRFLLALARGERAMPPGADPLGRAVLRGLSALGPGLTYEALIRDDRPGEALFRALAQLSTGAAGNPDATAHSLALLRTLGLEALARQLAVELVLMEGTA
ncbi:MAG: hypothetical protein KJN93_02485 [Alphaproteobacteria bacterium]|nr:hypothetical protein [Alphaproteobacteria bacterium]